MNTKKAEADEREQDVNHKSKILKECYASLMSMCWDLDRESAKHVIEAIAEGKIKHIMLIRDAEDNKNGN